MRKWLLILCSFCLMLIMPFAVGTLSVNANATPTTLENAYIGKVYDVAEGSPRDVDYYFYFADSITDATVGEQQREEYAKHVFVNGKSIYELRSEDNSGLVKLHFMAGDSGHGFMRVNYWDSEFASGDIIISTEEFVSPNGTTVPAFMATFSSFNEGDKAEIAATGTETPMPEPTTLTNAYVGKVYEVAEGAPRDIDYYFYFEDSITDSTVGEQQREEAAKHVFINGTSVYELRGEDNSGSVKLHFMAGDEFGFMRINYWDSEFTEGDMVITTDGELVSPNGTVIPAFTATFSSFNEGDKANELIPEPSEPTALTNAYIDEISGADYYFSFYFEDLVADETLAAQEDVEQYGSYVYINGECVKGMNANGNVVRLHFMGDGFIRINYWGTVDTTQDFVIEFKEGMVSPNGTVIPAFTATWSTFSVGDKADELMPEPATPTVLTNAYIDSIESGDYSFSFYFEDSITDLTLAAQELVDTYGKHVFINGQSVYDIRTEMNNDVRLHFMAGDNHGFMRVVYWGAMIETGTIVITTDGELVSPSNMAIPAFTATFSSLKSGEVADELKPETQPTEFSEAKVAWAAEQFIFFFEDNVVGDASLTGQHTVEKYASYVYINGESVYDIHQADSRYVRLHWMAGEGGYLRVDYYYNSENNANDNVLITIEEGLVSPVGYEIPAMSVLFVNGAVGTVGVIGATVSVHAVPVYFESTDGQDLTVTLNLGGATVNGVSINGTALTAEQFTVLGDKLTVDGAALSVGKNTVTVQTSNGEGAFVTSIIGNTTITEAKVKYANEQFIFQFNDVVIVGDSLTNQHTVDKYAQHIFINGKSIEEIHAENDAYVRMHWMSGEGSYLRIDYYYNSVNGINEPVWFSFDGELISPSGYRLPQTEVLFRSSSKGTSAETVKPLGEKENIDYILADGGDVSMKVWLSGATISAFEVNGSVVAMEDFTLVDGVLTLKATLFTAVGDYVFTVTTNKGNATFTVKVVSGVPEISEETKEMDKAVGGDLAFTVKTFGKEITSITLAGNEIAAENYTFENDTLTLKAAYVATLSVDEYALVVTTAIGNDTVTVNVINTTPVLNGDSSVTFDVALDDSLTIDVSLFDKEVVVCIGESALATAAYQITEDGIVFTKNYLKTLTSATTFVVRTASGEVSFTITVIDTKPVLESDASVDYDKYTDSTVAIEVDLKGKTLAYVKANGTAFAETDYTYTDGVITLKETAIKALEGEVTIAIGTESGEVAVTLFISDSTPVASSNDNPSCTSSISVGSLFAVVSILACTAFVAKKSRKED